MYSYIQRHYRASVAEIIVLTFQYVLILKMHHELVTHCHWTYMHVYTPAPVRASFSLCTADSAHEDEEEAEESNAADVSAGL